MKHTAKKMVMGAIAVTVCASPVAFASTTPVVAQPLTTIWKHDALLASQWMQKNQLQKSHEWAVLSTYAGTGTLQSSQWTTAELGNIKSSTDDARTILALLAAGLDPHNYNGHNLVADLTKSQLTTGDNAGKFADNIDGTGTDIIINQAWAITALEDAGNASYNRIAAANWLLQVQNKDGGFGSSKAYGDSDPDDTAAALVALSLLGYDKDSKPVTNALAYLKVTQAPDGGFGDGKSSNSDSTGVVIDALTSLGISPDSWTATGGTPSVALLSFFDPQTNGFKWDNTGGQYSGVNGFSTRDGLFGLGALTTQKSVYQRLHWQNFQWINTYWTNVYHNGGAWTNGRFTSWNELRPMAIAGSYVGELTPEWQAVVKAHGKYVVSGNKKAWEAWDTKLASQALRDSFGLNSLHLNWLS